MTHDIKAVGLTAGVVIGWHLCELTNLEAKLCEDVRHFKKAKPYWRPVILPRPPGRRDAQPRLRAAHPDPRGRGCSFFEPTPQVYKQRRSWPGAGVEVTAPRGRRARNSPRISRGCWRCSAKCGADALFPRMPEHCAVTLWLRSRGRAPAAPTKSSGRSLRRRSSWLWVAQRQPTCEISGNQLCQYHALQLDR